MRQWAQHTLDGLEPEYRRIEHAEFRLQEAIDAQRRVVEAAVYAPTDVKRTEAVKTAEEAVKMAEDELDSVRHYASYPPTLPDPDDHEGCVNYAKSWMTSIWHWVASCNMGDVVDTQFRVRGVTGLSVVDASVLPQVTRMNPTATLLALGRYAGRCKLGYCRGV
eukprot:Selendium_serpulae@DN5853_c3_g1_i1.p1